jgi:hypothetical protein
MRVPSVAHDEQGSLDEQEAQALAIHEAIGDEIKEHVEQQATYAKLILVGAAGAILVGLLLAASGMLGTGAGIAIIGVLVGIGGSAYLSTDEPDTTVQSIEKGYWTGHIIPDGERVVLFDATESIQPQEFTLSMLNNPDRAETVDQSLNAMSDFPVVMTDDTDVEQKFVDNITTIQDEIENSDTQRVSAPIIGSDDPAVDTLSSLESRAGESQIDAGGVSLSCEEAVEQVETFNQFETMANEDNGESLLFDVSEQSRELANELSGLQETATGLLNDHIGTAGNMFGAISYNFYCPDCIEDDIESQLETLSTDGEWYCDTCRSDHNPGDGVTRHQIRDDIILDLLDQLWTEKDDQRRQIYESIEDQKSDLEEREFEQRREEIRTVEERIRDIRSKVRDMKTEAKAKRGTIGEIGELMLKYDRIAENRVNDFQQEVTEAFEKIDAETERVLEETESLVDDRIEEAEKEAKENAELMREEERQRHRERMAHQEQLAKKQAAHNEQVAKKQAAHNEQVAKKQTAHDSQLAEKIAKTHHNKPPKRG